MMKKEKITAIPERKKDTYLTAVLSLPLRVHERAWLFTCGRSRIYAPMMYAFSQMTIRKGLRLSGRIWKPLSLPVIKMTWGISGACFSMQGSPQTGSVCVAPL